MKYSNMTEREVEIELSTSVGEGLTSFTAHDRLIENGRNTPEKVYTKSIFSVLLAQFTNIYTLAYIVMGVVTALFGYKANSVACVIFFAVAVINMVSGFLRDYNDRKYAIEFDKKRGGAVKIIRDGIRMESDPTLLVKGDIVILEEGDIVPCDIRILECDGLIADESIFKGRSAHCRKISEKCEDETDEAECPNMLYCGSSIVTGEAKGCVTAAGKETLLAKMNASGSKKLDTHDKFGQNSYSETALALGAILCGAVAMAVTMLKTKDFSLSMIQSCTAAMCLLPAPLCIVRTIGILFACRRLKKDSVSMEQRDFVYDIGVGEYFIFDKGGLITENEMRLEEKVISDNEKLKMAVICSDCRFSEDELLGNGMDKATALSLIEDGVDVRELLEENEKLLYMPFDEKRMLMASVTKTENGFRLIVKGSPLSVPILCNQLIDGDQIMAINGDILHRLEQLSSAMAEKGLKIRCVAYKDLDYVPENIETELRGLIFVGILGYREALAGDAQEAIDKIKNVYVKPIMVTGDGRVTVMALAKQAGLIEDENECVSFHELGDYSDEELLKAMEKYKVFSSATATDRERMVKVLSEYGKSVMVAGEQMTAPSAALYAGASFGDELMNDCDVLVEKSDIGHIAEVIYKARTVRENLAYSSLLAISVGFAEALVMLFMLLTGNINLPAVTDMLKTNMFVIFVPCLAVSMFAGIRKRRDEGKALALRCMLEGMVCALCILASDSDLITFTVMYAPLQAGCLTAMYGNLGKGRLGCWGIGTMAAAVVLGAVLLKAEIGVILFAALAAAVNTAIPYIKLKGLKSDV